MKTLEQILTKAKCDFQSRLRMGFPATAETIAHEIAKNSIPSSSKEILLLAARNLELAQEEPQKGPAFDGTFTAINLVAANIREAVFQSLVNSQSRYFDPDNVIRKSLYTKNLYEGIARNEEDP